MRTTPPRFRMNLVRPVFAILILIFTCQVFIGATETSSISGFVWKEDEANINHFYDPGQDDLVEGVQVILLDDEGNALDSLLTDNQGQYKFRYVKRGNYQVMFVIPEGLSFVQYRQGNNPNFDSEVQDEFNGKTGVFYLAQDGKKRYVNAGLRFRSLSANFVSFKGEWYPDKQMTILRWETALQQGTTVYSVYRSVENESSFTKIGSVQPQSSDGPIFSYEYQDEDIDGSGTYYYQVKELDADGITTSSTILAVEVDDRWTAPSPLVTYPNPAENAITAIAYLPNELSLGFNLFNMNGELVHIWKDQILPPGRHMLSLKLSEIPTGQYLLRATMGDEVYHQLVIKK